MSWIKVYKPKLEQGLDILFKQGSIRQVELEVRIKMGALMEASNYS